MNQIIRGETPSYALRGHSRSNVVRGDIFTNYGSGCHDGAATNFCTGQHDGSVADPNVFADIYDQLRFPDTMICVPDVRRLADSLSHDAIIMIESSDDADGVGDHGVGANSSVAFNGAELSDIDIVFDTKRGRGLQNRTYSDMDPLAQLNPATNRINCINFLKDRFCK